MRTENYQTGKKIKLGCGQEKFYIFGFCLFQIAPGIANR